MKTILSIALAAAFAAAIALSVQAAEAPHTVTLLDGRTLAGEVVALDDRTLSLRTGEKTETIPRADVLSVRFAASPPADLLAEPGRHIVELDDGSRLTATAPAIADGKLTFAWPSTAGTQRKAVPLERIVQLLLPRAAERPADVAREIAALRLPREARDVVVLSKKPGQFAPVSGILKSLDAARVVLNYDGSDTTMDAATVVAVRLAAVAGAAAPLPAGTVETAGGERLAFTAAAIKGGTLRLTTSALGEVQIPAASVAAIRFRNDRLAYLSDLEPADVKQAGYLGDTFPYVRDKAIGGGPLRLGGTVYEKGLGLHARTELTYDLGGAYKRLVAMAGIDDAVPLGAARLTILADGRALVDRLPLDRTGKPQAISVDVTGVRRLVIVADFGDAGFGAGQRVDLADAKLIK